MDHITEFYEGFGFEREFFEKILKTDDFIQKTFAYLYKNIETLQISPMEDLKGPKIL